MTITIDDIKELLAKVPNKLYIAGEWRNATDDKTLKVSNPANGTELLEISNASVADGLAALDAAVDAADSWANTAPRTRSNILRKAFDLLIEKREEFALLMTLEMGKPLAEARGEVNYGAEFLRWFSEEAVRIQGRYGLNPEGTGHMLVSQRPVGPCYLITPWNFPLAMATRKIAPALAAGCTAIVKPAELTPLTTLYFVKLLEEAGLPGGVINVITTSSSSAVSAPIISDPRLRKISFTGSTFVGRKLMEQAAEGILRTSMELGGNAPFLVFEDADIDQAVEGAMLAKFRNVGQACTAANRFIVHESVADEFANKLSEKVAQLKVGDGILDDTNIGPLVNTSAVDTTEELVQDAIKKGATVLAGAKRGSSEGCYYYPTVLNRLSSDARILSEEIFGPVAGIITFRTEEEAVKIANDTEYGLVSYVYTNDISRSTRMVDKLETGMMGLNTGIVSNAAAPFGGVKQSGLGREGSLEGINEYLSTKYTLIPAK